jgi:DNA-binding winged helix-turn-helix (wHTH) protein
MSGRMPGKPGGFSREPVARFGPFTLDPATRQLLRDGAAVHLTPKAFDLLILLVGEAPRVLAKADVHERLWPGTFVSDATLTGLVKELRRALDDRDPAAPIVRTSHGVGYAFAASIDRGSAAAPATPQIWHWIDVNGRRIRLLEGENVIGRDPAARVWLDVASVSRRHARIVVDDGAALLEDLGSKNRTTLGSTAVVDGVRLSDGDEIHVGPIRLLYRRSRSGMSTETQVGT